MSPKDFMAVAGGVACLVIALLAVGLMVLMTIDHLEDRRYRRRKEQREMARESVERLLR